MNKEKFRTAAKQIPSGKKQTMTKEVLRAHLESMFSPEKQLISRR